MNRRQVADFIQKQLQRVAGSRQVQQQEKSIWIQCPFHDEKTPSLSINTGDQNKPIGIFRCFGCKESGNWNKLASKLEINTLDLDQQYEDEPYFSVTDSDQKELGLIEPENNNTTQDSVEWNKNENWRGISGQLLYDLGAKLRYNQKVDDIKLWLPVYVMGELVGSIDCALSKEYEKQKTYINSPGGWTKYSLFPFDYVTNRFSCDYLVLVEGPRDALNLIQYGVPAFALMGSYWSRQKRDLILDLDPDLIILALDPDTAGRKNQKVIYNSLKNTAHIKKKSFEEGSDPADLGRADVRKMNRRSMRIVRRLKKYSLDKVA